MLQVHQIQLVSQSSPCSTVSYVFFFFSAFWQNSGNLPISLLSFSLWNNKFHSMISSGFLGDPFIYPLYRKSLYISSSRTDSDLCVIIVKVWSLAQFSMNQNPSVFQFNPISTPILLFARLANGPYVVVFPQSLNDCKSPKVSRTLLSILANTEVWLVSIPPTGFQFPTLFTNLLATVLSAPTTIRITVTLMFHSLIQSSCKVIYLSIFLQCFIFLLMVHWTARFTWWNFLKIKTTLEFGDLTFGRDKMIRSYIKIPKNASNYLG